MTLKDVLFNEPGTIACQIQNLVYRRPKNKMFSLSIV
jgi:hypothetical protein